MAFRKKNIQSIELYRNSWKKSHNVHSATITKLFSNIRQPRLYDTDNWKFTPLVLYKGIHCGRYLFYLFVQNIKSRYYNELFIIKTEPFKRYRGMCEVSRQRNVKLCAKSLKLGPLSQYSAYTDCNFSSLTRSYDVQMTVCSIPLTGIKTCFCLGTKAYEEARSSYVSNWIKYCPWKG